MWYVVLYCILISGCAQQQTQLEDNLLIGSDATYIIQSDNSTPITLQAEQCTINHKTHNITAQHAKVINNELIIFADNAIYNEETGIISLYQNIEACTQETSKTEANKAAIDTRNKRVLLSDVTTTIHKENAN